MSNKNNKTEFVSGKFSRGAPSFLELTELWRDGKYTEVGDAIRGWNARRATEFAAYFCKYVGSSQLEILHKFL